MADSQIRAFYSGKNFLITGGTGFVGLCLLERILRSLPDAGKVYLLMRPKGKTVGERLEKIMEIPLFDTLLQSNIDAFKKVVPIAGDVGEPNLGLSPEDRHLLDDVNIIVHSAAVLDFDLNLRILETNVFGTQRIMDLACQLKGLKVMIHVSSASVGMFLQEPKEILYDIPDNVDQILTSVKSLSKEELSLKEATLLKTHQIFYFFTKHLAEHEVAKHAKKFPCTIVRPSMILTTWKEPISGWTCSKAGITAFLMGVSKGVLRRLPLVRDNIIDFIPVDIVANQLLVAGWKASTEDLTIYHSTSSTQRPYRWGIMENVVLKMLHQYPLKSAIWYPRFKIVSPLLFKISDIFVHYIPAILLDLFLRLTGHRSVFYKLEKAWSIMRRTDRLMFSEWKFCNANTIELGRGMNGTDKKLFYIDISNIDWKTYTIDMFLGIRKYLHREADSNLTDARTKDTKLFVLHVVWHFVLFSFIWLVVAFLTGLTMVQSVWCIHVLYILYSFL